MLVFIVFGHSVSGFSQTENSPSEKEWEIRRDKVKVHSDKLMAELSEQDAARSYFYQAVYESLGQFNAGMNDYDRDRRQFKKGIFKLTLLLDDTSGYHFNYPESNVLKKAIVLKDSLYLLEELLREKDILSRNLNKMIQPTHYAAKSYELHIKEYERLNDLIQQITNHSKTLTSDTSAVTKLFQLATKEIALINDNNEVVVRNLNDCIEKLKQKYLESTGEVFSPAYEHYFGADKEDIKLKPGENESIYVVVDTPAEFPGGMDAFNEYIRRSLRMSEFVLKDSSQTKVYLRFVVSRHGFISNVQVKKGILDCPKCDKELLRVMKESPDWFPARLKGKPVNSHYVLPITLD